MEMRGSQYRRLVSFRACPAEIIAHRVSYGFAAVSIRRGATSCDRNEQRPPDERKSLNVEAHDGSNEGVSRKSKRRRRLSRNLASNAARIAALDVMAPSWQRRASCRHGPKLGE